MTCEKCGLELEVGMFPFCRGQQSDHIGGSSNRGHDEIPGGMWIENLGPVPIRVDSHSERLRIAKSKGLREFVRHVPVPGSDKSPHTERWVTMDAYTLNAAKELVMRHGSKASKEDSDDTRAYFRPFNFTGSKSDAAQIAAIIEGKA